MKYELFIAIGDAAEAYAADYDINEVARAINDCYAPSLKRYEFNTEEEKKAFQDALEFCGEECGCGSFYVIADCDVEENRELIESITL